MPPSRSARRIPPLLTTWLAIATLLFASVAVAQSKKVTADNEQWVFIPSVVGQTGNPAHVARKAAELLSSELSAQNKRVLPNESAKRLFEQRGSAPPMLANTSDIDELARDAQQALYHVASGLHSHARQDVERAMERARRALESLNRETRAAQHLLDACLYLVRGHIGRNDREEAKRQALDCKRLVPDIDPEPTMHPPSVIGVLAEAEAALLAREPSSLRIESDPVGCAVFVNGRNLGTTPKDLPRLSPGEYRVQVECHEGEPGRVHRTVLSNTRGVVRVDTRFERVVQTLFDLSMRYQNASEELSFRRQFALEAARIVGSSDLVTVRLSELGNEQQPIIEAERLRVSDGKVVAKVRLPLDKQGNAQRSILQSSVKALIGEQHIDLSGGPVLAIASEPLSPVVEEENLLPASEQVTRVAEVAPESLEVRSTHREYNATRITGYVLSGLGLVTSAVGWGLQMQLGSKQTTYAEAVNAQTPERFQAYREVENFARKPQITLGLGAAMLTAGMPLWLPENPRVPWWAWTGGGVGAVVAGIGIKLAVDTPGCLKDEFGRCTDHALATRIGTQLMLQSVPLLALPVVYGVRALLGRTPASRIDLQTTHGGLYLAWTKAL